MVDGQDLLSKGRVDKITIAILGIVQVMLIQSTCSDKPLVMKIYKSKEIHYNLFIHSCLLANNIAVCSKKTMFQRSSLTSLLSIIIKDKLKSSSSLSICFLFLSFW